MTQPLVIIGAGGFGREVLDIVDAINSSDPAFHLLGFVDDGEVPDEVLGRLGEVVLGGSAVLSDLPPTTRYVVAVGDPATRQRLVSRAEACGLEAATLVHPTVTSGRDVEIGPGSVLCAGVRLTTNIRIGRHCHLNPNSTVGHDSHLGDFVSLNPQTAVSGNVSIRDNVLMGARSVILQGLNAGPNSLIGAGAVVTKDVPPGVTVVGVPARPLLI